MGSVGWELFPIIKYPGCWFAVFVEELPSLGPLDVAGGAPLACDGTTDVGQAVEGHRLGSLGRKVRGGEPAQKRMGNAVEAEGAEPCVGPEVEMAVAFDNLGGKVFLGGGAKALLVAQRILFVFRFDEAEGADHEGVAGGLADVIAAGVPVVDDVELFTFRILEQFIEIAGDDHVEVEEEDAPAVEAAELIIAECGFLAVAVVVLLLGNIESGLEVHLNLRVKILHFVIGEEVKIHLLAGIAQDHGTQLVNVLAVVDGAPLDADYFYHRINY